MIPVLLDRRGSSKLARDEREEREAGPSSSPVYIFESIYITCVRVCLLAYSVDSRNEKLYCDVTFESGAGCNQQPRRATVYWQHSVGFILFYFLPRLISRRRKAIHDRDRLAGGRRHVTKSFDFPPTRFQPFHPHQT